MSSTVDSLHELERMYRTALAELYLITAVYTLLLYDTVLCAHAHFTQIRHARTAYLANHYGALAALTTFFSFASWSIYAGGFTVTSCKFVIALAFAGYAISMNLSNAIVLSRVRRLWQSERWVVRFTLAAWAGCIVLDTVMVALSIAQTLPQISSGKNVTTACIVAHIPAVAKAYGASPVAMQVLSLLLVVWNAADRPRRADTPLGAVLRRDGVFYFAGMLLLQTGFLLVILLTPARYGLVALQVTWSLAPVVLSRLTLWIEEHEARDARWSETGALALVDCEDAEVHLLDR